ncbi:MAG TPA: hypothetical protein VKL19_08345 [Thermoanaerobaculia bacterium]|nr:hypothetical protein [Thermoanaerobaculia bacterium]
MNADELAGHCPICRDMHAGGCCTALMPFSIVLLEIDDSTSADALKKAETALARAATVMNQLRVN